MGAGKSTIVGVAALDEVDEVEDGVEDTTDDAADIDPTVADVDVPCRFANTGSFNVDCGICAFTVSLDAITVGPVATGTLPRFESPPFDRGSSTGHKLHTKRCGSQ